MSNMNQSGEEQVECPLCMEPLEVDDLHFYPCTCGYQICRFCWNRIREGENGLCPACRKAYPEDPADFTPLSQEQVAALKTEKRAREQQRRTKTQESRRQLSSVRVVQRNLVFVVGLPVRLADPEILKRQEYFGKYGKIHKVVINHSTAYAGSQGPSASAYVTYVSGSDALRAIQNVNNVTIDGRVLKGSLGTTKYCANFMRNQPCPKPDCMYLHEMGDPKASFTKEEMHQGLHQVYERKLHNQLLAQTASNKDVTNTGGSQGGFIPSTVVTSSSINIANSNSLGGLGVGVMLSSSSSSSSSSGSSKEAWPSLGCSPPTSHSPTLRNESTPSPQPSNDIEPLGTNNIPQSNGKTKNRNSKDKANGEKWTKSQQQQQTNSAGTSSSKNNRQGKNKTDKHQRQHINNNNNPGSSNSSSNSNSNITENNIKLCNNGTQETNGTVLENNKPEDKDVGGVGSTTTNMEYSEQTFSNGQSLRENMLDGDDRHSLLDNLLDSSDHSLLEDNDNHDLLNDDCPIVSQDNTHSLLMNRYQGMMSGLPMHTQTMPTNINNLDFGAGMSCNGEYYNRLGGGDTGELLLLQRQQQLNMQQLNRPMHQQHHIRQHGLLDGQSVGSEGSRYIGENSMDKFLIDFHKNQQLKQMLRGAPAGPGALPATANVPSLTYIESHLHKYPGLQQAGNSKPLLMNPQSQQLLQQQHQQLQQQQEQQRQHTDDDLDFDPFKETQKAFAEMDIEKEILANKSREDGTEFGRTSRPPPGFTHMNAFGIGVPRPQTNSGFPGSGSGVSDWTQMDPAIMSTSCSFPQQNNDVLLQQQDMYARFNPQLHMNGMSKVLPLMQSASQQQPPHRGGNGLILPNTSSRQPQFMPGKLIPNGWNPQGGSLILQNGQQYNNMNAPRLNGFYNSNEMNTMKYGGIPLPPGFSSSVPQVQTKNSSNATECIESK